MKNQIIIKKIMPFFLAAILFISCNEKKAEVKEVVKKEDVNIVQLTREQAKTIEVKLGIIEMKVLSGAIKVNGMLDVPPQNLVSVSAPMAGFVKSTELLQGLKVMKGQVIAVLQNADYIQLQQDYLDSKSQLEYLEAEYKRQEELSRENVNSQKILLQSKTQYESMLAKTGGLKSKLNLLGINPAQVTAGNFQNTITLYASISGYVTQVNVNIGMFVSPTDIMFKIVDTEHLHAELTVFEKDIRKVKIGMKVRFTLANEFDERTATVYLIGREIGADRTVRVHCHLDKEDVDLMPGMYLKAYVEAGTHSVTALPDKAVVNYEDKDYIFVEDNQTANRYRMVEVKKGVVELGYTEISIPGGITDNIKVVINGAYDILAKMKNTEE